MSFRAAVIVFPGSNCDRDMAAWRYPSQMALAEHDDAGFAPLIAREAGLGEASAELRVFNGPTSPDVAVITDFFS